MALLGMNSTFMNPKIYPAKTYETLGMTSRKIKKMIHRRKFPRTSSLRDRGEEILKELPSSFPRESKEFRRGPDLPRRGESKAQETTKISQSKCQITCEVLRREDGVAGKE